MRTMFFHFFRNKEAFQRTINNLFFKKILFGALFIIQTSGIRFLRNLNLKKWHLKKKGKKLIDFLNETQRRNNEKNPVLIFWATLFIYKNNYPDNVDDIAVGNIFSTFRMSKNPSKLGPASNFDIFF